jgi:hypothetical protein
MGCLDHKSGDRIDKVFTDCASRHRKSSAHADMGIVRMAIAAGEKHAEGTGSLDDSLGCVL